MNFSDTIRALVAIELQNSEDRMWVVSSLAKLKYLPALSNCRLKGYPCRHSDHAARLSQQSQHANSSRLFLLLVGLHREEKLLLTGSCYPDSEFKWLRFTPQLSILLTHGRTD